MPPRKPLQGQQPLFPDDLPEPEPPKHKATTREQAAAGGPKAPTLRATWNPAPLDDMPDVRDGLTRKERIVLYTLHELERERPGRMVATAQLYGRVVERINMSVEELQRILQRMVGVEGGQSVRRPGPFSGEPPEDDDDRGGRV